MEAILNKIAVGLSSQFTVPVLMAWVLGVASYLLRNTHTVVIEFLSQIFLFRFDLTNYGSFSAINLSNSVGDFYKDYGILTKLVKRASIPGASSRNLWNSDSKNDIALGKFGLFPNARYYFKFNGKYGWIVLHRNSTPGIEFDKETIYITIVFGNVDDYKKIVEHLGALSERKRDRLYTDRIFVRSIRGSSCGSSHDEYAGKKIPVKPLETTILNTDVYGDNCLDSLIGGLKDYSQKREFIEAKGFPFKRVLLLHGKPGTGKTTLTKHIAKELKSDSIFSFDDISGLKSFLCGWDSVGQESMSVFLLEEIDSFKADAHIKDSGITRDAVGELLLALDGVDPIDNVILIITTNRLETIDPRIIRPGRVDEIIEVKFWRIEEANMYLKVVLGDEFIGFDVDEYRGLDYLIQPSKVYSVVENCFFECNKVSIQTKEYLDNLLNLDK